MAEPIEVPLEQVPIEDPMARLYTQMKPEDHEYFKENPDLLPARLRMERFGELQVEAPDTPAEQLYSQAYDEFESTTDKPMDLLNEPKPAPPPKPYENTEGIVKRIVNLPVRGAMGLGTGIVDFGLEATSGVARTLDYMAEGVRLDLFDDNNSWFYDIKEGLSEETKESVKSLGGLFPKGHTIPEVFTENLITIALGAYGLSLAAATGAGLRLAGAIGSTRAAGAVGSFLGRHQTLRTVSELAFTSARFDVSATLFSDPGSMASLFGVGSEERAKAFNEWYHSFDPITRRAENFAEGLFMNVVFGSIMRAMSRTQAPTPETPLLPGAEPRLQLEYNPPPVYPAEPQLTFKGDMVQFSNGTEVSASQLGESLHDLYMKIQRGVVEVTDVTPVDIQRTMNTEFDPIRAYTGMQENLQNIVREAVGGPDALTRQLNRTESVFDTGDIRFLETETVFDSTDLRHLDYDIVFDSTKGTIKNATEIIEKAPPAVVKDVQKAQKIAAATEDVTEAAVLKADQVVEKVIKESPAPSGEMVTPTVINKDVAEWYATVGAKEQISGIRFNSELDRYVFLKTKKLMASEELSPAALKALTWDNLPSGVSKKAAVAHAKAMHSGIVAAVKRTAPELSFEEALGKLKSVTIKLDPSDPAKATIDNGAVISESAVRKAGGNRDEFLSRLKVPLGRRGQMLVTSGALEEAFRYAGRGTLAALKLGAFVAKETGVAGGVVAGAISNYYGIDMNNDGDVNLKDMAIVAGMWTAAGYIGNLKVARQEAAFTQGRNDLVAAMKRGRQDFHNTLLLARSLARRAATSSVDQMVIDNARQTVKYLEDYLFSTKEGLEEWAKVPSIRTSLTNRSLTLDGASLNDLRLSLQSGSTERLTTGAITSIDRFDFASPRAVIQGFNDVFNQFLTVTRDPSVAAGLTARTQQITKMTEELLSEFEVPANVMNGTWRNLPLAEQTALIQTARTILGAIDGGIRPLLTIRDNLNPQQLHEFSNLINQRRAFGEYLRTGGQVGPKMTAATGYVARSAVMGNLPETFLRGLRDFKETQLTLETLRSLLHAEGANLRGPQITALVDKVGANMSLGQVATQGMYMGLFSSLRSVTWAGVENTIGFGVGITAEAFSALQRGQFTHEIIGPHGLIQGVTANLGTAIRAAKNRAIGEATGLTTAIGKEFSDHKFSEIMSRTLQLEDSSFVTQSFHKLLKVMKLDPTDIISAPDVFFRTLAFHGLENQRVIQEALGFARKNHVSVDTAVAAVRRDSVVMQGIYEEAMTKARRMTYTDVLKPDTLTGKTVSALQHPLIRLFIPIIKTPLTAARYMVRHTPFTAVAVAEDRAIMQKWVTGGIDSLTSADQRHLRDIGSRMTAGLLTAIGLYNVVQTGGWEIIGTGEYDPSFKAKQARGARQHGLWNSKTGEFISMERMSLFKMTLGALADMTHFRRKNQQVVSDEEQESYFATVGYMLYSSLTQAQPDQVDALKNVLGGADGYERAKSVMEHEYGSFLSRMIPAIFKTEGRASDKFRRAYQGPWENAVQSIYSGLGRGEEFRPSLDIYGERIENPRTLVATKGIPEGDELYSEAEAAGYDLSGYMKRRSRPGGKQLGSTQVEQDISFLSEKYQGESLKKIRGAFLNEVKRLNTPEEKKQAFARLFNGLAMEAKGKLASDPKYGATFRRLLGLTQ